MPANRYRSRSYKRVYKNTPGGENVLRYKKKKPSTFCNADGKECRSGGTRTRGLLVPNQTRYQTALHLEKASQQRDSNPRPAVYETAALPTEPCWHG